MSSLKFESALDCFGGTASVSHLLKSHGVAVTYNDQLQFNHQIGQALIANSRSRLTDEDVAMLLQRHNGVEYDDFIARTFGGVYFTKSENEWLDMMCRNIGFLRGPNKKALAYFALFQACLIKRPFNLFHRRNLYLRFARVERTFGNKRTWDKSFTTHFKRFVGEANQAVFDSGVPCSAVCYDALNVPLQDYDLVYIDTPYVRVNGSGDDYLDCYHFLEGLVDYDGWAARLDYTRKHLPFRHVPMPFVNNGSVQSIFSQLFERYADSIIVVSYRNDGIPSEEELIGLLKEVKTKVRLVRYGNYQYALSPNGNSNEILLIGT